MAGVVAACFGVFHFDHDSAEIAQHLGAGGACQNAGKIQYLDALQGAMGEAALGRAWLWVRCVHHILRVRFRQK